MGQTQIMNFFEQGEENVMNLEGTISGDGVYYWWSEEDRKMSWMREKRIKLFMQMELDNNCRNELVWLIRCHNCAANNCPEEIGVPSKTPTYSSRLYQQLAKEIGKDN